MEFKVRTKHLKNTGETIRGSKKAIVGVSSDVESAIKGLSSASSEYETIIHHLKELAVETERTGHSAGMFSINLSKIAVLYEETEKDIAKGKGGKRGKGGSGGSGGKGKSSSKKNNKDFWQRLAEKLGIKIDGYKGIPDWMEVIGWLNRAAPWTWAFYTATREGWLDDFFNFVDFEKADDGTIHVNTDKYDPSVINKLFKKKVITDENGICWQQFGGYTDAYDKVFDFFCDMEADRSLTFKAGGEEYTLWRWKGDYLNLGAGGEIGIYKGEGDFKQCAVDDELKISMHVDYGDGTSTDWSDETWWATSFNPNKQRYRAEDISITYTVDFSDADPKLWKGFVDGCGKHSDVIIDYENKTAYITY